MLDNRTATTGDISNSNTGNTKLNPSNQKSYKGNMTSKEAGNIVKNALKEQERIMAESEKNRMR